MLRNDGTAAAVPRSFQAGIFTREAGAVYKIGKMVRIRRDILEEYLRQKQIIEQDS